MFDNKSHRENKTTIDGKEKDTRYITSLTCHDAFQIRTENASKRESRHHVLFGNALIASPSRAIFAWRNRALPSHATTIGSLPVSTNTTASQKGSVPPHQRYHSNTVVVLFSMALETLLWERFRQGDSR